MYLKGNMIKLKKLNTNFSSYLRSLRDEKESEENLFSE